SMISTTRIPESGFHRLAPSRLKAHSRRALEKIADAFELVERGPRGDEQNLVEADPLQTLQPLARVVGQTDERHLGALGQAARFGLGAEVDDDIGEDGIGAAGFAVEAHAVLEILPAAVEARGDPALALLGGVADP